MFFLKIIFFVNISFSNNNLDFGSVNVDQSSSVVLTGNVSNISSIGEESFDIELISSFIDVHPSNNP